MPTILTIGYQDYLVRNADDAAKVLRVMAGAVPVKAKFLGAVTVYFPDTSAASRISVCAVPISQVLPCEPSPASDLDVDVTVEPSAAGKARNGARRRVNGARQPLLIEEGEA